MATASAMDGDFSSWSFRYSPAVMEQRILCSALARELPLWRIYSGLSQVSCDDGRRDGVVPVASHTVYTAPRRVWMDPISQQDQHDVVDRIDNDACARKPRMIAGVR